LTQAIDSNPAHLHQRGHYIALCAHNARGNLPDNVRYLANFSGEELANICVTLQNKWRGFLHAI
jgi:hypothetical protein